MCHLASPRMSSFKRVHRDTNLTKSLTLSFDTALLKRVLPSRGSYRVGVVMNKTELVDAAAERAGVSKKDAGRGH